MRKVILKRTNVKSFYKIVVSTTQVHQNEKAQNVVGYYDSQTKSLSLKKRRVTFYLNTGAIPTDAARALLFRTINLPY